MSCATENRIQTKESAETRKESNPQRQVERRGGRRNTRGSGREGKREKVLSKTWRKGDKLPFPCQPLFAFDATVSLLTSLPKSWQLGWPNKLPFTHPRPLPPRQLFSFSFCHSGFVWFWTLYSYSWTSLFSFKTGMLFDNNTFKKKINARRNSWTSSPGTGYNRWLLSATFSLLIMLSIFFSCESKISEKHRGWADFSLLPIKHLPRGRYC